VIPTPAWLARRLRSDQPTPEPKPALGLEDARPLLEKPAPGRIGRIETPPEPIRVSPPPEIRPRRTWINAELTGMDIDREAVVLERLAELTDRYGPREAAMRLFGGQR
jgi:hypothetical protein